MSRENSLRISKQIQDIVDAALAAKGVSARRASMDVVGHDGLIRDIRAGRIPSVDRLIALFEYLDIRPDEKNSSIETLLNLGVSIKEKVQLPGKGDEPSTGYFPISFDQSDQKHHGLSPLAVSEDWLNERSLMATDLNVVEMPNDGMEPSVRAGDLLLIDTSVEPSDEPGIFAFVADGEMNVGWAVEPSNSTIVVMFEKRFSSPATYKGKSRGRLRSLGLVVGCLNTGVSTQLSAQEKFNMLKIAQDL